MLFNNMEWHCPGCGHITNITVKVKPSSGDYIQIHPEESQSFMCERCGYNIPIYGDEIPNEYSYDRTLVVARWDDQNHQYVKRDLETKIQHLEMNLDAAKSLVDNMGAEIDMLKRKLTNNNLVNKL